MSSKVKAQSLPCRQTGLSADMAASRLAYCKQACLLQAGCKGFREERIGRNWTLRECKLGVLGSELSDRKKN